MERRAKLADRIGVFFWWTLLDTPGDDNSGHAKELSFRDGKITLLYESSGQPQVTEKPVTTTAKPTEPPVTTTTVTTPVTTEAPSVTEPPVQAPVRGDVDGNGSVNTIDVVELMHILIGKVNPSDNEMKNADMNDDGKVSIIDLILLKNKVIQ